MTREEFVQSGGDQSRPATYGDQRTATDWARTFSTWDDQTWCVVKGDGFFLAMSADRVEPWMGKVVAHYRRGGRA